jgi:rRNA maturation endonuclease Nob1
MSVLDELREQFAADDATEFPYECQACETRFAVQYQVCPECGGYTIDRAEWVHSDSATDDEP